ncbi:DUF397 domain-containing protein [Streptomyces sp. NPDC089922]|uniref:DUF397 domain-containing protein n=1 Tax=Streptomyces sp. NPDC089922 TaxID=3155189 RepID=UPI00343FC88A
MTEQPNWHKSTYSGTNDNCVEVADSLPGVVLIRDTKDHAQGRLTASPEAWAAFVSGVRG